MRDIFIEDKPPIVLHPVASFFSRVRWNIIGHLLFAVAFWTWLGWHLWKWAAK